MGIEDVETFHRDSRLIGGANPTQIIIDDFLEEGKMALKGSELDDIFAGDAKFEERLIPNPSMQVDDSWKHRSEGMVCRTCMYFVLKGQNTPDDEPLRLAIGRCRRHAPTISGWPVMFLTDWCGSHKLDENKI